MIPIDKTTRLNLIIETAWKIIFERIISNKLKINKESSLQLHLSKVLFELGNIYCILPNEYFDIEMESNYGKKSIDIICNLNEIRAAIELKCFLKASNRATDTDGYYALSDIERLENYEGFDLKKFICLTDNKYYPEKEQTGYGKNVTLRNGTIYPSNFEIIPGWKGYWKVKADPITFKNEVQCNWVTNSCWHYFKTDVT